MQHQVLQVIVLWCTVSAFVLASKFHNGSNSKHHLTACASTFKQKRCHTEDFAARPLVTSTLAYKTENEAHADAGLWMWRCNTHSANASGIVYSTYRYGTSSVELLAAVQQLAGPQTGLSIVDKAQAVVNTFKVLQTLQTVALLLQVRAEGKGGEGRPAVEEERGRLACAEQSALAAW